MTTRDAVRELKQRSLQNIRDLLTILEWNEAHGIRLFRITSNLFPHMNNAMLHPRFRTTSYFRGDISFAAEELAKVGAFARRYGHELSFHMNPFIQLASPNLDVLMRSVFDVIQYHRIYDAMGIPARQRTIILHIGGVYLKNADHEQKHAHHDCAEGGDHGVTGGSMGYTTPMSCTWGSTVAVPVTGNSVVSGAAAAPSSAIKVRDEKTRARVEQASKELADAKRKTLERWVKNYTELLPRDVQREIVLENDEWHYGVNDVLPVCESRNIRFCFDVFHNSISRDHVPVTPKLLDRVVATWRGRVPKFHLSEQDTGKRFGSHAERVRSIPDYFFTLARRVGRINIMLECKNKEVSVLRMMKKYGDRVEQH